MALAKIVGSNDWLAALFACLLVASGAFAGVGNAAVATDEAAASTHSTQFESQQTDPGNNTTRHQHPDRVSGDRNLPAVQRWLANRMSARLEDCVVNITLGQRDVCEFEDQYPDWLNKYVEVAGETGSETDDQAAENFEQAAGEAQAFSRNASEFQRTYQAYQEAKQAGNESRARQLARELIRLQRNTSRSSEQLTEEVSELQQTAEVNISAVRRLVNQTLANVSNTTQQVEEEQFIRTELTATMSPRSISFLSPGTVKGKLVAENGTAIGERSITLQIGERRISTVTDEEGRFNVTYRPTQIDLDSTAMRVQYIPGDLTVYLGSNTTVAFDVSQVKPSISVSLDRNRAGFGDTVTVTGKISAEGVAVDGVPVRVRLGDREAGRLVTNASGQFTVRVPIRAVDGPGTVTIEAGLPFDGQALAQASTSRQLSIDSTATTVSMSASLLTAETVQVVGGLQTLGGTAIPDQSISLLVNDSTVATVETNASGGFEATIDIPDGLMAGQTGSVLLVTASFSGAGTNLESAEARTRVDMRLGDSRQGGLIGALSALLNRAPIDSTGAVGIGGLVGLSVLVLLGRRWWQDWSVTTSPSMEEEPSQQAGERADAAEPLEERIQRVETARARLETDTDGAVMLAYATVRDRLTVSGQHERRTADTHWEFLSACRADGLDADTIDQLTTLTEAYEAAAYAPTSLDRTAAESALDSAEQLV